MRRSIHTFLQFYEYFTTTPVLLILPFSASILLLHVLSPSSLQSPVILISHDCLKPFLNFTGFSLYNSQFLPIVASVFGFTFFLTSLLAGKSLIIQALIHHKSSFPTPFCLFTKLYKPLLFTQLCNAVLVVVANAAAFSLLFLEAFGLSSNNALAMLLLRTVIYSFLANAGIICNLALVAAGAENRTGFAAIRKACSLAWTRNSITRAMNLPINLSILAVEGLFRYRVVGAYRLIGRCSPSMVLEGLFIAYLYSLLLVIDSIASCVFFKSVKENFQEDCAGRYYHQIRFAKEDINNLANSEISVVSR